MWGSGPFLHGIEGLFGSRYPADELVVGEVVTAQVLDDGPEVFGKGIARTTDGEFLLYKQLGLEGNLCLGIANEHHSSGEAHLVDGQGIGSRTA